MKTSVRRTLAMILCVLAVFSLFPVTADAADSYSMLSSKKVKIKFPTEFFDWTMTAKVKGGDKGKDKNSVYLVPRPETGNGDMGTIKNGSRAIILAEEDNYYFWMTTTGKLGWTSKKYFTEPEEVYYGYLWGESGISVDDIETLKYYLSEETCGIASKDFYANRAVLVLKKGESKQFSIYRKWNVDCPYSYTTNLGVKYTRTAHNVRVTIKANSTGFGRVEVSNKRNDQKFNVLVIVA